MANTKRPTDWTNPTTIQSHEETAALYGRRAMIAMQFAIQCDSETEAHYAYLNARWAARHALESMREKPGGGR